MHWHPGPICLENSALSIGLSLLVTATLIAVGQFAIYSFIYGVPILAVVALAILLVRWVKRSPIREELGHFGVQLGLAALHIALAAVRMNDRSTPDPGFGVAFYFLIFAPIVLAVSIGFFIGYLFRVFRPKS